MNKLDKLVEDKIRAEGWIKLLPTEKCETNQPHRFRYADKNFASINIIQHGTVLGVYQGPSWEAKYKIVDWDTPECGCNDCFLAKGMEELQRTGKAAASFALQIEGVDTEPVDLVTISALQVEEADNGYKQVSFYYKIPEVEINMTHDQLLAKIIAESNYDSGSNSRVLRAVMELHKPVCDDPKCCIDQGGCNCGQDFYPCLTVQAIEKELQ